MAHILTSLISSTLIVSLALAELDGADALLCDRASFDYRVYNHCLPIYSEAMATVNYQDECPWPNVQRHYFNLDSCVRHAGKVMACTQPSLHRQIFVDLHRTYFFHCPFLKDPDVAVLLLFALPCVIATLLFPCFCSYVTAREISMSNVGRE